ncbi:MAG: hypothetical protein PVI30_25650, partial [Myxococcales bacterium]
IRRPDDLLVMDLGLINLVEQDGALVREDDAARSCLVLQLPAQHINEEVINIGDDLPDRRFEALLSGPSRLVFELPGDVQSVPFDLQGVLEAVRSSRPSVSVQAAPPGGVELPQAGEGDADAQDGGDPQDAQDGGVAVVPGLGEAVIATPFQAASQRGEEEEDPADLSGMQLIAQVRIGHQSRQTQATTLAVAPPAPPPPGPGLEDQLAPPDIDMAGRPRAPEAHETAIEFPTRLIISPHEHVRFVHRSAPHLSSEGRAALWHTRMVPLNAQGQLDPNNLALSTVRAIWARGVFDPNRLVDPPEQMGPMQAFQNAQPSADDIAGPLTADTREQIVHQSSNFQDLVEYDGGEDAEPQPIRVDRLMLSSLGAFFDGQGDWTQKEGLNLLRWAQRSTLGRDHYVEVAFAGYLYPWGHRAVYVEIVQRQVPPSDEDEDRRAYLQKHALIILAEQDLSYRPDDASAAGEIESELRQTPVHRVRLLDLVSPKLRAAEQQNTIYKPELANLDDYLFAAQVFDQDGRDHKVQLPAVWVPGGRREWDDQDKDGVRELLAETGAARFGGQRVAFTRADVDYDAVRYETQSVVFEDSELSQSAQDDSGVHLPFLPRMLSADVGLDAARGLLKTGDNQTVSFASAYLDHGFGGVNADVQLLFELADELPMQFSNQSDKSGGLVAPDMALKAVSRVQGLIGGDLDNLNAGMVDVADVFPPGLDVGDLLPKLFGAVSLGDILEGFGLDMTPKLLSDVNDEISDLLSDIGRLTTQLQDVPGNVDGWISDHVDKQAAGYLQGADDLVQDLQDQLASLKDDLLDCIDALLQQFDAFLMQIGDGEYSDAIETLAALGDADNPDAPLPCLIGILEDVPFFPVSIIKKLRAAAKRLDEVVSVIEKLQPAFAALENAQEMLEQRIIRLEWSPTIKGDPAGFFVPHRLNDGFSLGVEVRPQAVGGKPAGADVFCSLEEFDIVLFPGTPVITIAFDRIAFEVQAGSKPDIDVVLGGLTFGGPLTFIEKIKEALPLDGFSDPPEIEVDVSGLRAFVDFPIPSVAVGIFSLENLAITASLHVPFIGDTIRLNFGFCSKQSPFILTVSMLGGGGYVGIEITPKGLSRLEMALEFGASLSVNFGVASGGVSIVAGIFLGIEAELVELTGYFRFRGYVQVLGIIGASIELGMELTYKKVGSSSKVVGRAWLIIEVTVLCFSKEVRIEAERKLAGNNEDPTFAEVMAPMPLGEGFDPVAGSDQVDTPWARYANAFA